MKKRSTFKGIGIIAAVILWEASSFAQADSLSLSKCYQSALEISESLKRSVEEINAAEARYRQALSYVFPQIAIGAQQRYRNSAKFGQVDGTTSAVVDNSDPSVSGRSSGLGKEQFEATFSISQPIFNGFRDIYVARSAEWRKKALELDLQRQRETLYKTVADLYFQVALYSADLRVLGDTIGLLKRRIVELEDFVKLGKARESEILAAQSDLEDARATHAQVEGLFEETRELLAFVTGIEASNLKVEMPKAPPAMNSLQTYLNMGLNRADLTASLQRKNAAESDKVVQERASWPALRLEGNSYLIEDPKRNRDWDVLIRLDIPIFTGGRISAQIAEADAILRQRKLAIEEQKRLIERDIRSNYVSLVSSIKEKGQVKKLTETAKKNLLIQKQDYSLGVVTNLEVLAAIGRVQDSQRRLLAVDAAIGRIQAALEVAAGGIGSDIR